MAKDKLLAQRKLYDVELEITQIEYQLMRFEFYIPYEGSLRTSFTMDETNIDRLIDALHEAKYRLHSDKPTQDEVWEQVKAQKD